MEPPTIFFARGARMKEAKRRRQKWRGREKRPDGEQEAGRGKSRGLVEIEDGQCGFKRKEKTSSRDPKKIAKGECP